MDVLLTDFGGTLSLRMLKVHDNAKETSRTMDCVGMGFPFFFLMALFTGVDCTSIS